MGDDNEGSSSQTAMEEDDRPVTIRVKTLTDRECTVQICLSETVSVLRERIYEKLGIEPTEQRIIFQGRVLVADRTLHSYGLQDGYTVHMIDRPPESSESFLNSRTGERPNNELGGSLAMRRARTSFDAMRQTMGQIMPRLNNLTIEQTDGEAMDNTAGAGRFMWRLFLEESEFTADRRNIEHFVRNAIRQIPYLTEEDQNRFRLVWTNDELRIDLPRMDPHVSSPAFERLAFIESNSNYLRTFNDILEEPNGLLAIVLRAMENSRTCDGSVNMTDDERAELNRQLEQIVIRLESISSTLPSNRSIDDVRVQNSSQAQRDARFERIPAERNNPSFVMRHVINTDLTQVLREFRRQQARFFELESVLDEVIETSAITILRERENNRTDGSYRALSAFYTHIQRMRHHISHTLHIISEVEVPFVNATNPQRLLPHYDLSRFNTPDAHVGTLVVAFRRPRDTQRVSEQVSNVFSPPKIRADVGRMQPGQWPYLTFYPTGMLQEQHEMAIPFMHLTVENMDDTMEYQQQASNSQPSTSTQPTQPTQPTQNAPNQSNVPSPSHLEFTREMGATVRRRIQEAREQQQRLAEAAENQPQRRPSIGQQFRERVGSYISRLRPDNRPSSASPTDAPTVTDNTSTSTAARPQLPPELRGDAESILRQMQQLQRMIPDMRRDMRIARGPETATLAPYPQTVSPTELHNIAQNIASRYRDEAITRIATNLTSAFLEQAPAWDTRLTSIPLRTLRLMLALMLELLTMSARNIDESREMMLALVRDESVLIRAIIESMKSMFLLGEFPTHVGRIILQQHSTVGQRVDYESRDGSDIFFRNVTDMIAEAQSDDMDDVLVRMPSDVSQPRSGSLRDIADARARRRQIVESRRNNADRPRQPPLTVTPGASFRPRDQAAIDAGVLPTGPARHPSFPSSVNPHPIPHPAGLSSDVEEIRRARWAQMEQTLENARQAFADNRAELAAELAENQPSTSGGANDMTPVSRVVRQTVSIDPFLSCHNRHSDFNRAHQLGSTGSEGDRMTSTSNEPNPDYTSYVQTLDIPQRETDVFVNDDDFTYQITRNGSGELIMESTDEGRMQFERIMRTALRSLFGQLVESDAIMALNSISFNGFPAPRNEAVQEILDRHFNLSNSGTEQNSIHVVVASSTVPDHLIPPDLPQRPRSAGEIVQGSGNDQNRQLSDPFFDPSQATSSSLPDISNLSEVGFQHSGLAPRNMRAPSDYMINTAPPRTPIEISSMALRSMHQFLASHVGSFPRGLFGLLSELLRNRIGQSDFGNLLHSENAIRIIGNMQNVFRQHLIENQMNGNARASREDIQSIAERLAAEESFFNLYNRGDPQNFSISIQGRAYSFGWTFRQLEIDTIRRLLELVLKKNEKEEFAKSVIEIIQTHLQRAISLFYFFYQSNFDLMETSLNQHFPTWVKLICDPSKDAQNVQIIAAIRRMIPTWINMFSFDTALEVASFLERLQNPSVTNLKSNNSSSNSPSSSPSTRERCGDVEAVGETSAKRRKRDDEMEVDVGEEALEDYDGTDKNEQSSSSKK